MASSSEIEKLERRYAENPEGRFFAPLADAYRKAGQVDRALELVRAGLTKHPDYLSAHIVLGRCLLDKAADADASATFRSVLSLDSENIIALKSLAEIAERSGRNDEAREWLQKLLSVDSMNAEAEADLQRLGGALAAPAPAAEQAPAEVAPETSFADLAQEMRAAPSREAVPAVAEAAPPPAEAAPVHAEPPPAAEVTAASAEPPTAAEAAPAPEEPVPAPAEAAPAHPEAETTRVVAAVQPPAPIEELELEKAAGAATEEPIAESAPVPVLEMPEAAPEPVARTAQPALALPDLPSLDEMPVEPVEAGAEEIPEPMAAAAAAEPAPVKPDVHPLPADVSVSSESLDVTPFDDSLEWGTGERSSRAIRAEDVEAVAHDAAVRAPAVEFMSEMGLPGAEESAPPAEEPAPAGPPPAAAAAVPSLDEFMIEPPPDQSLGGMEVSGGEKVELPADLSGAYSIVDAVAGSVVDFPEVPEPVARPSGPTPVPQGLPLIMPEDVTPPEEFARPSAKMVQMVSPPPREEPAAHPPMATETMGDLYLKQGFRSEAAEVYRRLLAQRPSDAGLAQKLRAAESPPPDLRAASLGAESVGTWLKRVAGARLSVAAPAPALAPPLPSSPPPSPPLPSSPPPSPPSPSSGAPTPLESVFMAEPEGEPAHPAPDAFSLDQIFGAGDAASAPAQSAPNAPAAPPPPAGASFDDFFGAPAPAPAPPAPAEAPKRPSQLGDEDLTAFSAWLQGLKK